MLVASSLDEYAHLVSPAARHAVTIGNFDGVHVGHRELIRITREKAAARGEASALVTFDPHPVRVVRSLSGMDLLTPLPRKLELLEQTGLDLVLVLPFTRETAEQTAEDFVRDILVERLRATDLVTGFNFALGKNRGGTLSTLQKLGERNHFAVTQLPPVIVGRETVSSTLVREYIRSGNVAGVKPLLGRMHSVDGEIVHGKARGRDLGFPTANIAYGDVLLPPLGAYATWLQVLSDGAKGQALPCMTSVGTNPTFGGGAVTLESHILDFSGDLYGKTVRLYFAARLRAEIRFRSVAELVARLQGDATAARAILATGKTEHFL